MRRSRIGLPALVVFAVLPAAALATTMVFLDVTAKARGADVIAHGKVVSSESRWTGGGAGGGRRIITETVIDVQDTWKGEASAKVTVRQPGGIVGDLGQKVDGVAPFRDGEEVVVFLEARPGGAFLLHGMGQGKYRVERSADGKGAFAVPAATGEAVLVDPSTGQRVVTRHETMELGALRRAVAQAVGGAPVEGVTPGQKTPAPTPSPVPSPSPVPVPAPDESESK